MTTKKTVVYECTKCGTEVTVKSDGVKIVDPIYCCGLPTVMTKRGAVKTQRKRSDMPQSGMKPVKPGTRKTPTKGKP